ncbi:Rpn family recombination-promoting nuclease/putative transposase [Alkalinema pantanalense CENA528]|uniref:Rpn family recombination-promoting nuclease/putative transposase n=1 Tax=Alkalinema pantanalense TaxID=1620705 RepID=UPI003D6E42DE
MTHGKSELGTRFTDKLFKVQLQSGEETWILVHIEVQSQEDSGFAERMFVYNYRCFDRYRKPVISLAVLGDERTTWRPSSYGYNLGGCRVGIQFPIAKLIDYETQWEELDQSRNPFVVMVMAHLKTKATTGQPQQRKQWKWTLVRKLFEQGYSRNDVVELFRLIDWMMTAVDPSIWTRSNES